VNSTFDLPRTKATPAELAAALRDSLYHHPASGRRLQRRAVDRPLPAIVNPPLWETGHVAWFLERWVLRRSGAPSMLARADTLYDSGRIAHVARWFLPLPSPEDTLALPGAGHQRRAAGSWIPDGCPRPGNSTTSNCPSITRTCTTRRSATMRQTWGYEDPLGHGYGQRAIQGDAMPSGDAEVVAGEGGTRVAARMRGFVFDNEKWAMPLPFRFCDRGAVP